VHNASELPIETTLTYFLFKVVIGRAYCFKQDSSKKLPASCPEGYDSVYLETD
jgi:hypothetical protein